MNLRRLRIRPVNYGSPVVVKIGDGPATLTSSATGWVSKSRPGNVSLTQWEGIDTITQDVPFMIDDFRRGRGIEYILYALRSLAGIGENQWDGYPPTVVRIDGAIHFPNKRWIIEDIAEGEGSIRLPHTGELTRYIGTLKIREWIGVRQIYGVATQTDVKRNGMGRKWAIQS